MGEGDEPLTRSGVEAPSGCLRPHGLTAQRVQSSVVEVVDDEADSRWREREGVSDLDGGAQLSGEAEHGGPLACEVVVPADGLPEGVVLGVGEGADVEVSGHGGEARKHKIPLVIALGYAGASDDRGAGRVLMRAGHRIYQTLMLSLNGAIC